MRGGFLANMGDSIDNIPGVPGVGEKTAVKLISQFGSVERLYENLTLVQGKVRETLATHREQAFLSRELATVSTRVPIAQDLEAFKRQEPDWERLRALWTELEFETLLRQLPAAETPVVVTESLPRLEGPAALQQWLADVPAADPVAVDWVGEGGPPAPGLTALGVYHPAAGAAILPLDAGAPDFGGRKLVGHDIKHLIAWWLARGNPPAFEDTAVGAYLLNPARTSYKLDDVSAELLGQGPGLAAVGSRARWVWQIWEMLPRALKEVGLHTLYVDLEQPLVPVLAAMPVHGEYRHLLQHSRLAEKAGVPRDQIFLVEDGLGLELSKSGARVLGGYPAGRVFVDGKGIGDVGSVVLRDRQLLAEAGMVVVALTIDRVTGSLVAGPEIASRGFVYMKESDELMAEVKEAVREAIAQREDPEVLDRELFGARIRSAVRRFINQRFQRKPIVIPVIMEKAKEIVRLIKDSKIKVQASIQEKQVRVAGKNRDDLQAVIALIKGKDLGVALQFTNYRSN